jgi:hypothetical protein
MLGKHLAGVRPDFGKGMGLESRGLKGQGKATNAGKQIQDSGSAPRARRSPLGGAVQPFDLFDRYHGVTKGDEMDGPVRICTWRC